ncbi:MAG: NAD(P)-dependent alcohol dehydrogenase [Acidobacteriota bacterium]
MKAYEVQEFGIDKLALMEQDPPEPDSHEVVVKFHAASVNYRDLMVIGGAYNPHMKLPAIPFSDGAGEVTAVGGEVSKWKVGDRVMPIFVQEWIDGGPTEEKRRTALGAGSQWQGVLREFGAFSEQGLARVPDHLSYEEASTLPCAAVTAWQALVVSGGLKAGDTVLTLGTGGVSVFALQIAKMFGAQVISTSSSDEKLERMRMLGADEIINYKAREDWDTAVLELTRRRGVDHVVEVGGGGTLARSINSVRVGGHVALIGALEAAGNFGYVPIFMKQIRLHGIFTGSRDMFEDMNRAIGAAKLKPVVDHVFSFDQVPAALKHMESGSHFGKVVVRIGE